MAAMRKIGMVSAVCCMALTLGGCGEQWRHAMLEQDSSMVSQKITVKPGMKEMQVATAQEDASALAVLAGEYQKNGRGDVRVVVTYDPASSANNGDVALDALTRIEDTLRKDGITNVTGSLQQVAGTESQLYIGYKALVAQAPDCRQMGGLDGTPTQATSESKVEFGCAIDGQIAQQIANPADLEGRAGLDEGSGRRQGNIPMAYQKGTQNPALQNIQSSTSTSSQ